MSCTSDSSQSFPYAGRLKENLNLSLGDLRQKVQDDLQKKTDGSQAKVYSYIVATVKNHKNTFVQTGSAPNFQGDVISLCTCKHFMRSFQDVDSWPGTWIAGFTGINAGKEGRNALIYLMKVRFAFESHYDLWFSDAKNLPNSVKQAKSARKNKFGDIFQPQSKGIDKFNFEHYYRPVSDHSHAPKDRWYKDINYLKGASGRKAALLIGDVRYSFLWDKPILFYSHPLSRGQRKDNLQSLLDSLRRKKDNL